MNRQAYIKAIEPHYTGYQELHVHSEASYRDAVNMPTWKTAPSNMEPYTLPPIKMGTLNPFPSILTTGISMSLSAAVLAPISSVRKPKQAPV